MRRSPSVRIANGSVYLDAEVYSEFFGGRDAVAVAVRDGRIALFPVSGTGAGGSLAKVRNARGDRVIVAREFFRSIDLDQPRSHELAAEWNPELAALTFARPRPDEV